MHQSAPLNRVQNRTFPGKEEEKVDFGIEHPWLALPGALYGGHYLAGITSAAVLCRCQVACSLSSARHTIARGSQETTRTIGLLGCLDACQ